jgi:hypothetical protein
VAEPSRRFIFRASFEGCNSASIQVVLRPALQGLLPDPIHTFLEEEAQLAKYVVCRENRAYQLQS